MLFLLHHLFLFLLFPFFVFFFNDTATTEIYTLSLHDALPIFQLGIAISSEGELAPVLERIVTQARRFTGAERSEEHTSELQSHSDLVCRLLLEKKKKIETKHMKQNQQKNNNTSDKRN